MLAIYNTTVTDDADGKNAIGVFGGNEFENSSLIGDTCEVDDVVAWEQSKVRDGVVANGLAVDVEVLHHLTHVHRDGGSIRDESLAIQVGAIRCWCQANAEIEHSESFKIVHACIGRSISRSVPTGIDVLTSRCQDLVEVHCRRWEGLFVDGDPSAYGDSIGLAGEDQLVIGNELGHIGDGHRLVDHNVLLAERLRSRNLEISERDDVGLGVFKEERHVERREHRMEGTVALADGDQVQMYGTRGRIRHYLLVQQQL